MEHEDNILRPDVIQQVRTQKFNREFTLFHHLLIQMYRVYKKVREIETSNGRKWDDMCVKLPILSTEDIGLKRPKRQSNNDLDMEFDDNFGVDEMEDSEDVFAAIKTGAGQGEEFDPSVIFYPDSYCPVVESMATACYETSLLEIFAIKGEFTEQSDRMIEQLTQEKLIELVSNVKLR